VKVYAIREVIEMEGHMPDLNLLVKKFQERIESLQGELEGAKKNLTVVLEAIELLKREGVFGQQRLFKAPDMISDRFKDISMTQAIEDILRDKQPDKLSADEIYSDLIGNGFKSDSQNLKRDVYSRLNRMKNSGKIISTKKARGKMIKYFLPPKEKALQSGSDSSSLATANLRPSQLKGEGKGE